MTPCRRRGQRGQLLLEVLIGATVLSVVVAGALATIQAGHRVVLESGRRADALASAQETLEQLRNDVTNGTTAVPVAATLTGGVAPGVLYADPLNPPSSGLAPEFGGTRNYRVVDNPAGLPGFKQVTVTVQWNEP